MVTRKPKHILIAPLDWGLGHTTRCVPLIRQILRLGHIPIFAGNQSQRSFIEETFGAIDNIHLDGYDITYSVWNRFGQAGILSQLPRITKTISAEQKWLLQLCNDRKIDGIISDNRYGLFHNSIPSVIITHQLQVRSGMGSITDRAVQKIHYKFLNRFHGTWVADAPGKTNLGGSLSHTSSFPHNTTYIGLLSQFENTEAFEKTGDKLLILLSGPEPQRTILARILWQQVQDHKGNVVFIEGTEQATAPGNIPSHIHYYKRLTNKTLFPLLQQAAIVICRSGYSTLMDLVALRKKAILIPTPGQTEQEYLARHLRSQQVFYSTKQNNFNLSTALQQAQQFPTQPPALNDSYTTHKKVLEDWLQTL